MKFILLGVLALVIQPALGIIRNVALDGTQAYITIQSAIDASINGDVIQVYPGIYPEYLETNGKSITLQSLYAINHILSEIDRTVIHPLVAASCIEIESGETVTVNGFTLTNNDPVSLMPDFYDTVNQLGWSGVGGGGIEATFNSSVIIKNCIIQHCISACGGIYFDGNSFSMSNTIIRDCIGVENTGGGLTVWGDNATNFTFDSLSQNSIYGNIPNDIYLRDIPFPIDIPLAKCSVIMEQPDNYFIYTNGCAQVNLDIDQAYYSLINHDLYVSPTGNDTNSGLSASEPLKSIEYAARIIEPDSLNPKTIHLASGVYSTAENDQYFPVHLKSHTKLTGASSQNTILDMNDRGQDYIVSIYSSDVEVSNLKFWGYHNIYYPVGISNSNRMTFLNLIFEGNFVQQSGISAFNSNDVLFENILVRNSIAENDDNPAFWIFYSDNVVLNNCIADNMSITGYDSNYLGFMFYDSDVIIRNSIVSNCMADNSYIFFYQNVYAPDSLYKLDMSNVLICHNHSSINDSWAPALVWVNSKFQRAQINNCTIANNWGSDTCPIQITSNVDIRNCIFYNPLMFWDVGLNIAVEPAIPYSASISNTLLHAASVAGNQLDLVEQNNLITSSNPLFAGVNSDSLTMSDPSYYWLSANSPCINTGLADTTGLNIPSIDLAGNRRVWDGNIDMGCYEYGSPHVGNDDPAQTIPVPVISISSYPNPVYQQNGRAEAVFLEFSLPVQPAKNPIIEIYNIKGQRVKSIEVTNSLKEIRSQTLNNEEYKSSQVPYSVVWNLKSDQNHVVGSGLYIIKLNAGKYQAVNKMMVIR